MLFTANNMANKQYSYVVYSKQHGKELGHRYITASPGMRVNTPKGHWGHTDDEIEMLTTEDGTMV